MGQAETKEQPISMTKSIHKKAKKQQGDVHEYEITMALGFDVEIQNICYQQNIISQFMRDRFYQKDTYIVVDSTSYQHLFQQASQGDFTKILIKSPPYLHCLDRLIENKKLKLNDAEARKIQLNVLFTIPDQCQFIPQFVQKLIELNKHFGRINHLVIDCRINTLQQIIDQFKNIKVPCQLAYEVEFVLNIRPSDVVQIINLKPIHKLAKILGEQVSYDLSILNIPLNQITGMLHDINDIKSLALKLKGAYRQDHNQYTQLLAQIKNKTQLKSLLLDFSQLPYFRVENVLGQMQLKYLHINSYAFNSDQLIEICPMDSDNLHYLGLHFSSSEFLPSVLLKIAENTLKQTKNTFKHLNIAFQSSSSKNTTQLFQALHKIVDTSQKSYKNHFCLESLILTLNGCQFAKDSIEAFEKLIEIGFNSAKGQFYTTFQTLYLGISIYFSVSLNQSQFNLIFNILSDGFRYISTKKEFDKRNPLMFSQLYLIFQNIESEEFSLEVLKPLSSNLSKCLEKIPDYYMFLSTLYLDFSQNQLKVQTITDLNITFATLKATKQNFSTEFTLILSSCHLRSDQVNTIFEGLKLMAEPAAKNALAKNFKKVKIDLSCNEKIDNLESFSSFVEYLAYANCINQKSLEYLDINFSGTLIEGSSFVHLPDHFLSIANAAQQHSRVLEKIVINLKKTRISDESLNYLITALLNLHTLVDSQKINASTLNEIVLILDEVRMSSQQIELLSRLLENQINASQNNFHTFNIFILSLLNSSNDLRIFNSLKKQMDKLQQIRNQLPLESFCVDTNCLEVNQISNQLNFRNKVFK